MHDCVRVIVDVYVVCCCVAVVFMLCLCGIAVDLIVSWL